MVLILALFVKEEPELYGLDLLDLKNDYVFKEFFGDPRNSNLLIDFLSAILDVRIQKVVERDTELKIVHSKDMKTTLDIRVETETGEQINIEMQVRNHDALKERMLLYLSKMCAGQGRKGLKYSELKRVIQIIVTDFDMVDEDSFHNVYKMVNVMTGSIFSSHFQVHVLELTKSSEVNHAFMSELDKWLLFIKGDVKTKEALALESPSLKEAFREIQRMSENPATRDIANSREKFLLDQIQYEQDARNKGLAEGQEIGKEKAKVEFVISLYNDQFSNEEISRLTKLPVTKVQEIIASIVN